jgi:hypothetical protein
MQVCGTAAGVDTNRLSYAGDEAGKRQRYNLKGHRPSPYHQCSQPRAGSDTLLQARTSLRCSGHGKPNSSASVAEDIGVNGTEQGHAEAAETRREAPTSSST